MSNSTKAATNLPHIVVVDDNPDIRLEIEEFLTRQNFRVSTAEDGDTMRDVLERRAADLIIMDLTMPKEDGLTLVNSIRKTSNAGIIILTGRGDLIDRVVGLETGADDYLAKPCDLHELLARIRSVLRRTADAADVDTVGANSWYEFAGWHLNVSTRQLISPDRVEVPFTTAEFSLLVTFVQNGQRVLSRDQLLDLTQKREWSPFDRAIDNQVCRLRRKLESDPKHPIFIKTIRGVGYMFAPKVRKLRSLDPDLLADGENSQ